MKFRAKINKIIHKKKFTDMKELIVQSKTEKAKTILYYNEKKKKYEIENYLIINKKVFQAKTYTEENTTEAYKVFYRCTLVNNKIHIEFNTENLEDYEELPI